MRRNTEDKTLEKNYLQKWRFLVHEYELVKRKKHVRFKFVTDFYHHHGINRQTFCKYYNRYLQEQDESGFLPRKRGPKWTTRRPPKEIENLVIEQRKNGTNRYEVYAILKPILLERTPSPSGIYNVFKRNGINRLNKKMKEEKQRIIKTKAGELGHVDCHYLSKDLILNDSKRYYLVCVIDSCTRIAWAEVVEDISSLTVMFAALKALNMLNKEYDIKFNEILSDNGSEFSSKTNISQHPFERMLYELGIKHRYTRPYRPQTNGKVERFWRTLEDDLIEGTVFESLDDFKNQLMTYMMYYNNYRPHQGIDGKIPKDFRKNLSTN